MSGGNLDHLFSLWGQCHPDDRSPFNHQGNLYSQIDSVERGEAPWHCLKTRYQGVVDNMSPVWKMCEYEIWHHNPNDILRNLLDNPNFYDAFDAVPYQ